MLLAISLLSAKRIGVANTLPIQGWSTRDVPSRRRVDYCVHAISSGLEPMRVEIANTEHFSAELSCLDMGGVIVSRGVGPALRCLHGRAEVNRCAGRNYHVVINRRSDWTVDQRGQKRVRAGDALLLDSDLEYAINYPRFDNAHLILSDAWVRRWIAAPGTLAGRCIVSDSTWGRAFCHYVSRLTPAMMVDAPLPAATLADHIGVLLSLVAQEWGMADATRRRDVMLRNRIQDTILQRATEPGITADAVAASVNISVRTLHRQLAAHGETFGRSLMSARIDIAARMLESHSFRRLTIAEIGRRSGFSDPSHLGRVCRARFGLTPQQLRVRAPVQGTGRPIAS